MKDAELRALLDQMTLDEKIGQLVQLSGDCFGEEMSRPGLPQRSA